MSLLSNGTGRELAATSQLSCPDQPSVKHSPSLPAPDAETHRHGRVSNHCRSPAGIRRVLTRWSINPLLFLTFCDFFSVATHSLSSSSPQKLINCQWAINKWFWAFNVRWVWCKLSWTQEWITCHPSKAVSFFHRVASLFFSGRNLSELKPFCPDSAKGIFQNWKLNWLMASLCLPLLAHALILWYEEKNPE